MKNLILFLTMFCLAAPQASAEDMKPKLDEPMARRLMAEASLGSAEHMDYFSYDGDDLDKDSNFYGYDGIDPNAEGIFGAFVVNKWTGDVWSLWDCKIISNNASLSLQAQIRKRFTSDEMKQYERLAAIKPGCLNDGAEE